MDKNNKITKIFLSVFVLANICLEAQVTHCAKKSSDCMGLKIVLRNE